MLRSFDTLQFVEQANVDLTKFLQCVNDLIDDMSLNHNISKHMNNHGSMTAYF